MVVAWTMRFRRVCFNVFFTTKGTRGTGIGMMLTKKIIEVHKGEIHFASQRGKGTSFVIRLPRLSAAEEETVDF